MQKVVAAAANEVSGARSAMECFMILMSIWERDKTVFVNVESDVE